MSNVTVNGKGLQGAWVRDVQQGTLRHSARALEQADGYDTLGVRLANGEEKLILSRSAKQAKAGDHVTVDGQKAVVVLSENEANTFSEGFKGAFARKGTKIAAGASAAAGGGMLGVLGYLFSSLPVPRNVLSSTLGGGVVGALVAGGAAVLGIGGWNGLKAARARVDNTVSDRIVASVPPARSEAPRYEVK